MNNNFQLIVWLMEITPFELLVFAQDIVFQIELGAYNEFCYIAYFTDEYDFH